MPDSELRNGKDLDTIKQTYASETLPFDGTESASSSPPSLTRSYYSAASASSSMAESRHFGFANGPLSNSHTQGTMAGSSVRSDGTVRGDFLNNDTTNYNILIKS